MQRIFTRFTWARDIARILQPKERMVICKQHARSSRSQIKRYTISEPEPRCLPPACTSNPTCPCLSFSSLSFYLPDYTRLLHLTFPPRLARHLLGHPFYFEMATHGSRSHDKPRVAMTKEGSEHGRYAITLVPKPRRAALVSHALLHVITTNSL